jgi:carbon-monoxide dehydrogenase medium subunit
VAWRKQAGRRRARELNVPLQGLFRPRTVDEAIALLAQDPDARPLAGGATLVAMMNARVAEPAALVSLGSIDEIQGISTLPDGRVRIGAFTRHRETAACTLPLGACGVVRHAASQIANATVRNMGTIGGSIAFADPGLDYPPALVAARAVVEIASAGGRRTVDAGDFFVDWYTTALESGELVTAVILPRPAGGSGLYVKHARVAGDYATASVAACLHADGRMRVAVGSCGPTPLADEEADAILSADTSYAAVARAGALLQARADPLDDVRGSADYRRLLIPRLLLRAVRSIHAADRGAA